MLTLAKLRAVRDMLEANARTEAEVTMANLAAGAFNPLVMPRVIEVEPGAFRLDGGEYGLGSWVVLPPALADALRSAQKP